MIETEGTLSKMLEAFEALCLKSETLRELLEELTEEDGLTAEDRIHWYQAIRTPDQEDPDGVRLIHDRPLAILEIIEDGRTLDDERELIGGGVLLLSVEAYYPLEYLPDYENDNTAELINKHNQRMNWGLNLAYGTLEDLEENSGRDGVLNVNNLQMAEGPGDQTEEETDPFIGFAIEMRWA